MKFHSLALTVLLILPLRAVADQNVWLDFNAGWQTSLSAVAGSAGVPAFTPGEISVLESAIENAFISAYDGYTVNFFTADPGGARERVDFGATTADGTLLGQTSFDFRNASQGTQDVYVANFDFFIENGEPRAQQLDELATSLAGTAIHELGHAFGLRHFHAYGDTRITPANYANTQGLQNEHFMATGSTGLTEVGREMPRTFSDWSRVHLEAGSRLSDTTVNPFLELFVGDVGGGPGSAATLPLQSFNVSDAIAGFAIGELGDDTDADVYQVSVDTSSWLTAEIWSGGLYDGILRLYDGLGSELAFADDVRYSATTIGSGTTFSDDPFMLNIPVAPGDYFLEIAAAGPVPLGFGDYTLSLGLFTVPEPTGWLGFAIGWFAMGRRVRRAFNGRRTS